MSFDDPESTLDSWMSFVQAERELNGDEPVKDGDVVLSFSGCGASVFVTWGDLRKTLEEVVRLRGETKEWSSELPTVQGHYWRRNGPTDEDPEVVWFDVYPVEGSGWLTIGSECPNNIYGDPDSQWLGPIKPGVV